MLKNIIKIGMLACALCIAGSVSAQEKTYAPEYPQYGFWSNWSLGIDLGWGHQFGNGLSWGHGSDLSSNFYIEKELNHVWDFRMKFGGPGHIAHNCDNTCTETAFDRFGMIGFGFKFNLIDACAGYKPERKGSLYLALDGGVELYGDEPTFGNCGIFGDLGLGFSLKVCKHSTLFLEADLIACGDIQDPQVMTAKNGSTDYYTTVSLGYMFNFGPTAADLELIAQRAKLTQENFDALNDEISRLNTEVANGKQAEQRLQNNVNDLEDRLAACLKNQNNSAKADSLQGVINQIKDDQLMYYALPFSILYDVDQWRVPADQNDKVKAIARVIKDNENAKFNIVGFCDKSGSDAYNMKLSQKRAEELKRVLVEKYGIAEDRISCDWKGKGMAFGDIEYSVNRRASVYRVIE